MTKNRKTFNTNFIKNTLNYSTNDIAELYRIHKRTVQEWYKQGLTRIDDRKPYLVLGAHLKEFLENRQKKRKTKCRIDEFFCCKCKSPRKAWENLVDLKILNHKNLLIMGLCDICNTKINKISSNKSNTSE